MPPSLHCNRLLLPVRQLRRRGPPPPLPRSRRPRGGVVTQRTANPYTPVRFRAWPPISCLPLPHAQPTRLRLPLGQPFRLERARCWFLWHPIAMTWPRSGTCDGCAGAAAGRGRIGECRGPLSAPPVAQRPCPPRETRYAARCPCLPIRSVRGRDRPRSTG
jgi:hypothetical protein